DVEDTYWGIKTINHENRWAVPPEEWDFIVMIFTDPRFKNGPAGAGGVELDFDTHEVIWSWIEETFSMINPDELADHPEAKNYWDTYKSPEYWAYMGKYPSYPYTWPEYLDNGIFDGTYGDELSSGGRIDVKSTNSQEQPEAWKSFLSASGLDNIVRDGNSGGKDLTPPEFDATYKKLADRDGLYIGLSDSINDEFNFSDYDEWIQVLEERVGIAVERLNEGEIESDKIARKVKFINTYTGKWNVLLEIDLEKMQKADKYPDNGIIYTQVPIRFTNAEKLPRKMANYGFTVMGEENVYLKGDFNVDEWVTAAVVSKKRVFTLSDDFNDPQNKPATQHYRDYPYLYVKDNGSGTYVESNPALGGGMWVYRDYLNHATTEYYNQISSENEQVLKNIIIQKDAAYLSMFDKKDDSGAKTDTFTWPASGESYTYGMMPNTVSKNHTYNCLIAANRDVKGYSLERWGSARKYLNGSFFILESTGFTAPYRSLVDYEPGTGTGAKDLPYDNRDRLAYGRTYDYAGYAVSAPSTYLSYDPRFKTAARSPSDVFFGGAQSLWMESTPEFFYQLSF
ncbi:MAG: hypothetical protein KKF93_07370, partial [Candidatus Omnitrophica bacterium]|nr:hypothetical protein [Candidatus Omnitrophota bacterium]